MNPLPPEYWRFWQLWSQEEFYACHEELEQAWRKEQCRQRKQFFQGLIHCAVAIYQARRGNAVGACRQRVRAEVRLTPYLPELEGVNLIATLSQVSLEVKPLEASLTEPQFEQLKKLKRSLKLRYSAWSGNDKVSQLEKLNE